MNTIRSITNTLNERLFSSTYQLRRVVIVMAVLLGVSLISFAIYYYQDRYYSAQPTTQQLTVAEAEKAVRDDPQNADKRLHLAETYIVYRRYDDALKQATQVKEVQPNSTGADFVIGLAYANNGKPVEAIQPLQKFIDSRKGEDMPALDPQLQAALYYLGDSYLQLGQPDQAVDPLETTVKQVGTDADSIYKLGIAYAGVKRYDDALKAFHLATAFVPNYAEAYQAMGQVYAIQNQAAGADYARAMVAYSKKDYATAYSILVTVNQAAPGFAPGFTGTGLTCEAQKDLQCALSSYQVAAKLDPSDMTANQGVQRVETELQK